MDSTRRRLTCPKCGARYEVDANLIPLAGRDVQCSNCGHTWFEARDPTGETPVAAAAAPVTAAPAAVQKTVPPVPPSLPPEEEEPAEAEAPGAVPPVAPQLDDAVRQLLMDEAQREASARKGSGVETQSELGLAGTARGGVRDKLGQARQHEGSTDASSAAGIGSAVTAGSRRDLLPDIEEINSSLKSAQDRYADGLAEGTYDEESPRRGFRRGFVMVVLLATIALAVYAFAGEISARFPQVKPALDSYVAFVDRARNAVDKQAQEWIKAIRGVEAEISSETPAAPAPAAPAPAAPATTTAPASGG